MSCENRVRGPGREGASQKNGSPVVIDLSLGAWVCVLTVLYQITTNSVHLFSYSARGRKSRLSWQGGIPFGGSKGGSAFLPFPAVCIPWLTASCYIILCVCCHVSFTLTFLSSSYKDRCDCIEPFQTTKESLPMSRFLP